ncbi:L,D-transpeptidase catalytic domain protein [Atopobium sp. BS2]|uniref:L,D-transpeptidase family protein n=1 Tax=Atopobium sp. BS2 TaxID=936550 RepID=UPI00044DE81F|nr:L,D-transpeptidase family protein [Atopobium sp. BS2]EWC93773.1 L,D-transpeptidase catalytic domain protein [Atopobium sp. BS2]
MKKKTQSPYKPSAQKLIAAASLSAALLCGLHAAPALAETADTSAVSAPVVTTETTATAENTSPTATESSQPASPAAPTTTTPTTNPTPAAPTENTTPTPQSSRWRQENGQFHYYKEDGTLVTSQWIKDDSGWHYVDAAGNAAKGWYTTPNGKTWYFDPSQDAYPAFVGAHLIDGKAYFFDEGYGLVTKGWVHHQDGTWSYIGSDGSFLSDWKQLPNGKWFYFDTEDPLHRMKVGVVQLSSGTFYVDESTGMTSNSWVHLPNGGWAWAQSSGAFASGWFNTPNGKTWYFDSTKLGNPAYIGEHSINGKDYYFDEGYGLIRNSWVTLTNGVKRWAGPDGMLTGRLSPNGIFTADNGTQPTGTVKLPGLTLHIGSDHKVKTGWVKENGKDYYYLNDGSAASDWVNIQGTYYYFNTNGEKQTGWVHLKSGWYYLGADGKMRTGWIKDNGKDYYLDSNGTMVTGYTTWGGKLYWSDADGAMEEQPCYYPDMYRYAQNYYSATNWLIQIDTTGNRFAVYRGSHGNWVVWYEWQCTTGAPGMWTPHGQFTVGNKGLYFGSGYRCWYYTTISGEYLIHSILYNSDGYTVRDGRLGYNGSHGCVRLATENAKWVYDNIPYGTKIVIW